MQPRLRAASNPAFVRSAEYRPFKLGKCSDHLHHHPSRSSSRINRFRQTPESGFSFLNPFHDHQNVSERRESRSRRETMRTSPFLNWSSRRWIGRSHRPPCLSRKIFSQPADFSAETCAAVSCSFVETRAYPNFIIAKTSRHSFSLSNTFQQLAEPLSSMLPDSVLKGSFAQWR